VRAGANLSEVRSVELAGERGGQPPATVRGLRFGSEDEQRRCDPSPFKGISQMFDQPDYFVESRSNAELRRIAEKHRAQIDPDRIGEIDILRILESGFVETEKGRKRLALVPVPDGEMGNDDAVSISEERVATLRVKESVLRSAKNREEKAAHRRAVFTLVHEYFHIALCHDRAPMPRATGVNAASSRPSFIPAHRSAEHQANYATGVLLIDPELATTCRTAAEICLRFNVSKKAAAIFLEERSRQEKSSVVSQGLRELSRSLGRSTNLGSQVSEKQPGFEAKIVCTACGQRGRYGIGGSRSKCAKCGATGDAQQDGDPLMGLEF
jgi:hypothetical protein